MTAEQAREQAQVLNSLIQAEQTGDFTSLATRIRRWDGSGEEPNPLTSEEREIFEKGEDKQAVQRGRMSREEAEFKRRVYDGLKVAERTGDFAPLSKEYDSEDQSYEPTVDERKSFEDWRNWFLLKRGRMSLVEFNQKRKVLEVGTLRFSAEEKRAQRENLYQRSIDSGQMTREEAERQRKVVDELEAAGDSGDIARLLNGVQGLIRLHAEAAAQNGDTSSVQRVNEVIHSLEMAKTDATKTLLDLRHKQPALIGAHEEIRTKLPPKTALVSFIEYVAETGPAYFAMVVSSTTEIAWVPLGTGSNINAAVVRYRKMMTSEMSDQSATNLLSELGDLIWKPVQRALPKDLQGLVLSPEGSLSLVSFATLFVDGKFLGETTSFSYLSSPKDLTKTAYRTNGSVVMIADPRYDLPFPETPPRGKPPVVNLDLLKGLRLEELSSTRDESTNLKATCQRYGFSEVHTIQGADATEGLFRSIQRPFLLHVAVHGCYLPGVLLPAGGGPVVVDKLLPPSIANSANQSWLLLAGAGSTIRAWSEGRVPDPTMDGIITPEDIQRMNLEGTWLVSLAACDTGYGVPFFGEGVGGLRRSFVSAGAQHLLLTLWPVASKKSVEFMNEFYGEALRSLDAPSSLAKVQGALLRKWRLDDRIGPAQAAKFAGAFVLSSRGF